LVQNILLPRRNRASAQPLVTLRFINSRAWCRACCARHGALDRQFRALRRRQDRRLRWRERRQGAPPLLQSHWRSRRDAPLRRDHRVLNYSHGWI